MVVAGKKGRQKWMKTSRENQATVAFCSRGQEMAEGRVSRVAKNPWSPAQAAGSEGLGGVSTVAHCGRTWTTPEGPWAQGNPLSHPVGLGGWSQVNEGPGAFPSAHLSAGQRVCHGLTWVGGTSLDQESRGAL